MKEQWISKWKAEFNKIVKKYFESSSLSSLLAPAPDFQHFKHFIILSSTVYTLISLLLKKMETFAILEIGFILQV